LFDLISIRKIVYESLLSLEADLRIDREELERIVSQFSADEIFNLGELYKKKCTRNFSKVLIKELK
jgi:hypothetical protein